LRDLEADAQVTLRDLLSHRTGVQAGSEEEEIWYLQNSREVAIKIGMRAKPTAKFRERFSYSNVMYLAAGEAIAKAQHTSWEELIANRIFNPLGMTASNFSIEAMQQAADFSNGYSGDKSQRKLPMQNMWIVSPAAAINSNAREMAQWLRLLLGGGSLNGKRLVSTIGFQEMLTKLTGVDDEKSYGLGLFIEKSHSSRQRLLYWHGGSLDGFTSWVGFIPEQKLGIALLTNSSSSGVKFYQAATSIVFAHLLR
jgi:CubicO group peptidase (beta-lactamase class C family)